MISTPHRNTIAALSNSNLDLPVADNAPLAPEPATNGKPNKTLNLRLLELADELPIQFHLRGFSRCGTTTLLVALANFVNSRADVRGTTERSDVLRKQSNDVILGCGTKPTKDDELEVFKCKLRYRWTGVVSCPQEPPNIKAAETADFYRAWPNFIFMPLIWGPAAHATTLRNVFFGQAGTLQKKSVMGTDPSVVLRAAFHLATNDERDNALEAYGVDGLDEMMADPKLATSRIIVSPRRGSLARLRFDGLGTKGIRYEEILVELTDKVVKLERLNGLDALREILHSLPDPMLCVAGWDLVREYDALYRQPDLPDELFRWFIGPHRARTNKNLLTFCNIRGRIKTDPSRLGQKYIESTSTEGAEALLNVMDERMPPIDVASEVKTATTAADTVEHTMESAPAPELPSSAPVAAGKVERGECEEQGCNREDAMRESVFHASQAIPAVLVLMLLAAMASVSAAAWWLTLILIIGVTIIGGRIWTQLRTQLFHGTWSMLPDGRIELRRGVQQTSQPTNQLRLAASAWERWLDTGRCYVGDDDRPWRVYRLSRFVKVTVKTARPSSLGAWAQVSLAGLILLAIWISVLR